MCNLVATSDFFYKTALTRISDRRFDIPNEIENEKGGMKLKSIINFLQSLSPAECQSPEMLTTPPN